MTVRPLGRPGRLAGAGLAPLLAPLLAAVLLGGCASATAADEAVEPTAERATPEQEIPEAAAPTTALAALAALEIKGRAPRTGYDRDLFGNGWVDVDRNGCDTRNDVLARDLTGETFKPGTRDCVVLTGSLADPYSGRTIVFQRGQGTSEAVQIDHVVALSDAWQKGAQQWDATKRARFANDPLNLLAVDGPLNMQKGDGDAATWLPPVRSFRCAYVARQVAVKLSYGAWATQAEKNAMATVLSACPEEPLPAGGPPVPPAPVPPAPAPAVLPDATASYANCAEVEAAGATPIRAGDPGFSPSFDGDGDGVGCES